MKGIFFILLLTIAALHKGNSNGIDVVPSSWQMKPWKSRTDTISEDFSVCNMHLSANTTCVHTNHVSAFTFLHIKLWVICLLNMHRSLTAKPATGETESALGWVVLHHGLLTCMRRRRVQELQWKCVCIGGCRRSFSCITLLLWKNQEPLHGGQPLWHQRGPAGLGSWACELPQVIRERLEKTVTRKEISREGRSNKALNNSPSVEGHWGHRPRD